MGAPPDPACPPPVRGDPLPGLGPDSYRQWRASTAGAIAEQLERDLVLGLIGDVAGRRVLDVGCGDGVLALELRRRGAEVTAIDLSQAMIAAARQRALKQRADVGLAVAEVARLPFAPQSFDLVTAITILCFVADAAPVFDELARVLRPGGRLVIGELNKWSSWAAARRLRAWLGSPLWRKARFRTAGELRALARGAGLQPAALRGAVYFPRAAAAARLLAPWDGTLGRLTTAGAAFLALSAIKQPVSRGPRLR